MKQVLFLSICIFTLSQILFSQYNTAWVRTLDGPVQYWDEASAIAVDDSGNVFVTGKDITGVGSICDYMTAKYNLSGELQWVKILDIFPHDAPACIAIDNAGNVIVSGYGNVGYTTIKYSSAGDSLWAAVFYAGNPGGNAITVDDSNNIYLAGTDNYQSVAVKYNADGVVQWSKHYSGPENNRAWTKCINIDDAGYIYVAGRTELLSGNSGFLLMKYDSSGDTIWTRTYGDTLYDCVINAITTDASCNIYLTGYSRVTLYITYFITIKYDSGGNLQWAKTMSPTGSSFGQGFAVSVDKASNVYVAGNCNRSGSFSDFVTTKYNSNGDSVWAKFYNGTANNNDYLYDMVMDSLSNIYITGGTYEFIGGWNCVTIMYDSSGLQKAIQKFDGNANGEDEGFAVALDKWNNVYVAGRTTDSVHYFDYLIIKYGENLVNVKESPSPSPVEYKLHQNYPNPFNPTTTIKFDLPKASFVSLKVYNVLGQEVATLVNEKRETGSYEVKFNASTLSSGIYFYRLCAETYAETKKLILVK